MEKKARRFKKTNTKKKIQFFVVEEKEEDE